jgi:hypothetical protein
MSRETLRLHRSCLGRMPNRHWKGTLMLVHHNEQSKDSNHWLRPHGPVKGNRGGVLAGARRTVLDPGRGTDLELGPYGIAFPLRQANRGR